MTMPAKLKLRAWRPKIEGTGSELVLVLDGVKPHPRRKFDVTWRGEIRISVDRPFVRFLVEAVAEMQKNDRERLAREARRLVSEVEALTGKQPTEST